MIELDAHINDPEFIDPVIEAFLLMMERQEVIIPMERLCRNMKKPIL
jgi:hypothetical protein